MAVKSHLHIGTEIKLVFLHGWGMNRRIFSPLIEALRAMDIQCESLDLPGYGDAQSDCQGNTNLTEMAQIVEAKLPHNTVLIGWSLGGLIAQKLATLQSNKLVGLVSVCSTPKFASADGWKGIELKVLKGFEQALEFDYQRTIKRFITLQNMGQAHAHAKTNIQDMLHTLLNQPEPSKAVLLNGLALLANEDLRDKISSITVPTLRVYGRLDALVPVQNVAKIQDLQKCAKSVVYSKASHAPFISHEDDFVQDLHTFISSKVLDSEQK